MENKKLEEFIEIMDCILLEKIEFYEPKIKSDIYEIIDEIEIIDDLLLLVTRVNMLPFSEEVFRIEIVGNIFERAIKVAEKGERLHNFKKIANKIKKTIQIDDLTQGLRDVLMKIYNQIQAKMNLKGISLKIKFDNVNVITKSLVFNITLGSFSQSSKRPSMMDIQNKVFAQFLNIEEASAQYRRIEKADGDNVKVDLLFYFEYYSDEKIVDLISIQNKVYYLKTNLKYEIDYYLLSFDESQQLVEFIDDSETGELSATQLNDLENLLLKLDRSL